MKAQTFRKRSAMPATARALWDWHARPGAFERLNPPWDPVQVLERSGGLAVGARTAIKMSLGRWVSVHTAAEEPNLFRDEQESGPFAKWVHTHRFLDQGLEDEIEYMLPMAGLGRAFGGEFARSTLERTFAYRHAITRLDLERHARFADRPRLKVAVSGASGLIGSQLGPFLTTGGHEVRPMKRGAGGAAIDVAALEGADAVIHLAGSGIGDGRWTRTRRATMVTSRIDFTRALVAALGTLRQRPKVLISGSAIGIYGDRGDEELDEGSALGHGGPKGAAFLAQLCEDWEAEGLAAEKLGLRVVLARTGIVLSAAGGALKKMLPAFRAGAGGPIGGGKAWMSWVGFEDVIGALHHALFTESVSGPVNLVAGSPVTNAEFGKALGRVLGRPAVAPIPAFAVKAIFGEMADGTVLASQRVRPGALVASGYHLVHPDLEPALRFTLGR